MFPGGRHSTSFPEVRYVPKASQAVPKFNFRFAPDSGLRADIADGPLSVNKRHAQLRNSVERASYNYSHAKEYGCAPSLSPAQQL